jgi:hypothetical protein
MSFCEGILMPMAEFGPSERIFVFPQLQAAIAWGLLAALIASAIGIAQQLEPRNVSGARRARGFLRRRLPAVWSSDPPVIPPPRRGVGGINVRVPPRSAAGSTLLRFGRRSTVDGRR